VTLPPDKSLADFSQSQAKTKVSCSQNTKHGTAEPFHFLNTSPMSDVTMLRRLCVGDLGHAMCVSLLLNKISARAKPKPRFFTASTQSMALLNQFISSIWVQ
jgi:hypothetical protein